MWAVRAVSAGVRCDAFAGAALPGPLCGDDRELERHELPDRPQGLPQRPHRLCGGGGHGLRGRGAAGAAGARSGAGRLSLCSGAGVRRHADAGCLAALPLFSGPAGQPLALSALGGPLSAAGPDGPVHRHRAVCPPCAGLDGAHRRAGEGAVLRGTVLRRPGIAGLSEHPGHHGELRGVGGGAVLPPLPHLLQLTACSTTAAWWATSPPPGKRCWRC